MTNQKKCTLEDLTNDLYQAFHDIKDGKLTVDKANAMKGVADSVCKLQTLGLHFRTEFDANKHAGFFPGEGQPPRVASTQSFPLLKSNGGK